MNYARNTLLNKKLPSYTGFFVLLATLGITLLLSGNAFIFVSRATVGSDPKNIQISNITDASFTISYTTDASSVGTISYGTDPSTPNIALDDRDQQASGSADYQVHFITVKNLIPSTKYYYAIDSGSQRAENNGSPFTITTAAPLSNSSGSQSTISGTVQLSDGSTPTEGIVYVTSASSQQLAGLINPDGTYSIPLNNLRNSTLTSTASLTPNTVMQLQAVTPTQESTATILASQAYQVPKIVLSQNYDFTLNTSGGSEISDLAASGSAVAFPVLSTPAPVSSPEITTPTEAEAFKEQPVFEGRALPNTEVDILIQSQQEISAKLQSDDTGTWEFKPPVTLAPGNHTITIKSVDASGVLQTISRSFIVYASGSQFIEPSISPISPSPIASASPTLAPTAIPTPTVAPTAAPAPTESPKLTAVPSTEPLPKTGSSALIASIIAALSVTGAGALLFFAL